MKRTSSLLNMKGGEEMVCSTSKRYLSNRLPITAGLAVGALVTTASYAVVSDLTDALAWGTAAGTVVAGTDPRLFLSLAIFFLFLPPIALLRDFDRLAEDLSRTAFALLAIGVALELRQQFLQGRARGDDSKGE